METQRVKEFMDAKVRYVQSRLNERDLITNALIKRGYTIMNMICTKPLSNPYSRQAGRGLTNYTSGGRIAVYDLSNWMWVSAMKEGIWAGIALQALEADKSGYFNHHILYDRLAFEGGLSNGDNYNYVVTNYDLPLSLPQVDKLMIDFDAFVAAIKNP